MIRGIISLFLLTLVSSVTIASLLSSSPTFFPAAIASSFTTQKEQANSTSIFKITDEIKDRINALVDSNRTNAAIVIGLLIRTELSSIAMVKYLMQIMLQLTKIQFSPSVLTLKFLLQFC